MTTGRTTRQYAFLAATTRSFAFIALIAASVLASDSAAALTMVSIGCVWLAASAAERMPIPRLVAIVIEAASGRYRLRTRRAGHHPGARPP